MDIGCQSGAAGTIYSIKANKLIVSGGYQWTINAKTMIENTNPTDSSF